MNQKAYKALEYYKIINMLTDKASSPMGKDLCRKLTPSTDIEEVLWGLVNFLPSAVFLRTPIVSKLILEVSAVILSRTLWTGCSRHWNH